MNKRLLIPICFALFSIFGGPALAKEPSDQSDTWLEAKLITTMMLNRHLSVFDISSEVNEGIASLTGIVNSDIEKNLATEVAKSIDGIKGVENHILVDHHKADGYQMGKVSQSERTFGEKIDDLTTTATIKTKLVANQNIDGLDIDVSTHKGNVVLEGVVESSKERALVVQIVKNTEGVMSVTEKLRVGS